MTIVLVVDDTPVDRRLAGGLLGQSEELEIKYAEDGAVALEMIRQAAPDIVVTDLQMPEVDGLQLVNSIQMAHPQVPVILMTAQGSEAIAIEALEQGASSYVPKSQLAARLLDTVLEVLAMSRAESTSNRLSECQRMAEFEYDLENDEDLIDALVERVQDQMHGMHFAEHTVKLRIGVALREALRNALFRGNLEIRGDIASELPQRLQQPPYRDRRIACSGRIDSSQARFVVRDQGPGFDSSAFQARDLASPESLSPQAGRGIVLMRTFMDEVIFNDAGNEVTLVKRRDATA